MKKLFAILASFIVWIADGQQSVTVQNNGSGTGTFNTPGVTTYLFTPSQTVNFGGATLIGIPATFGVSQLLAGTNITLSPTNGLGNVTVTASGVSPGGSNTQLQYNNSGAFGGTAGLTWNGNALSNSQSFNSGIQPFLATNTNTGTGANVAFWAYNATDSMRVGITGTGYTGPVLTGGTSGEVGFITTSGNQPINFGINTTFIGSMTSTGLNNMAIGATTASTGAFTTLSASGTSVFTGNVGIGQASSTQALAITGAANNYAETLLSGNTSGQDYGLNIQAGSTSADFALNIINRAASALFSVRGDGLVSVNNAVTIDSSGNIVSPGTLSVSNLIPTTITWGSTVVPVLNGGTGTSTPGLVQGTGVTISGSWPNQTITAPGYATHLGTFASPDTTAGSITWTSPVLNIFTSASAALRTYTLPAASSYSGQAFILNVAVGTNHVNVQPASGAQLVLAGVLLTANHYVQAATSAAGNYICFISDGTNWNSLGNAGTWADASSP